MNRLQTTNLIERGTNKMAKNKVPDRSYDQLIELAISTGLLSDMDGYCFLHLPREKKKWAIHHLLEVSIKEHKVQTEMAMTYCDRLRRERGVQPEDYCKTEANGVPHPAELHRKINTKLFTEEEN
jgi:hypothetical protein